MEVSSEPLFDLTQEYDEMLHRGLKLSGETREFFMRGRVADLAAELSERKAPRRILGHPGAYWTWDADWGTRRRISPLFLTRHASSGWTRPPELSSTRRRSTEESESASRI